MQTNKAISKKSKLYKKGQKLIKSAYNYWQEYQKECGSAAVVWLDAEDGHFILFTRSEYKSDIIPRALFTSNNPPLENPFVEK